VVQAEGGWSFEELVAPAPSSSPALRNPVAYASRPPRKETIAPGWSLTFQLSIVLLQSGYPVCPWGESALIAPSKQFRSVSAGHSSKSGLPLPSWANLARPLLPAPSATRVLAYSATPSALPRRALSVICLGPAGGRSRTRSDLVAAVLFRYRYRWKNGRGHEFCLVSSRTVGRE